MSSIRNDVMIRAARPGDLTALAWRFGYDEILDRETVALFRGDTMRARVFLVERAFDRAPERTLVADYRGGLIGVLDYELPGDPHRSRFSTLADLARAAHARLSYRTLCARMLVNSPFPDDAVVIANVRVLNGWRGLGIGARLLRTVEADCKFGNYQRLALSVLHDNPAVRLYMREGYAVYDIKQHPWYLGGTSRVLMVKPVAYDAYDYGLTR